MVKSEHAVIIALLIVLVVLVVFQSSKGKGHGCSGETGKYDTYRSAPREGFQNPWATVDKMHRVVQGSPDGPKILKDHRNLIPQLARAKASATPEEMHKAERAAWFSARDVGKRAAFNTEKMTEIEDQIHQEHATEPDIDWQDALVDLIADKRVRENQRKWNSEMEPFNTTWLKVDDSDEITMYGLGIPRQGIAYAMGSAPPTVHNPWQLTELDPTLASVAKPFRFQG